MAEGGRTSVTTSTYKGSDEVFEFTCMPCVQDGSNVEAVKFCADCGEFLCLACTGYHKKFVATSGHNVVGTDQADQSICLLPTERCRKHQGERISTYCAEHNVVVCGSCLAFDHRACKGRSYIAKIAGGPGQRKDEQRVKVEISEALNTISQVKLSIQDRQATADTEKEKFFNHIKQYTEKLIKHAHGLEKAAVANVNDHHKKMTNVLQSEKKSADEVSEKMETRLNNLSNTLVTNHSQTFVDIKQGEKEVQAAKLLGERIKSSSLGQGVASFAVEDSVDAFFNINLLGKVITTKPYKVVLKGQYNVKMKNDMNTCMIDDTCTILNGTVLMTDHNNKCIKILDKTNKVSKSFKLPSEPWGICQTSQAEVAVTLLHDKQVQFVNITGKWRLTQSFQVENHCRGITYSNDQLLVSCRDALKEVPGFVGIYDMSGTILHKIQVDLHGRQIFSVPRHITTTGNGMKIHVADEKGDVITVNRKGNVLWRLSENLKFTRGVCVVSDHCLIACGGETNNVLQIDTSGNVITELLNRKDGMNDPFSVSYVRDSSCLIVTFNNSDEIKMFDLVS